VEYGTKRQQFVELAGIVADAVGSGDENLPAFFHKGPSLVDRDNNAQPYRRHGFFASCRLHNEGHGNPFLRKCPMTRSSKFRSSASQCANAVGIPQGSFVLRRFNGRVGSRVFDQNHLDQRDLKQTSNMRFRADLHGQAIQKIFQSLPAGQLSRVMRAEAAFPQSDAHGLALAAYLPAPGVPIAPGNGNVE
jgi:hypothetical protein